MSTTQGVLEKLRGLDAPTLLALVDKFPDERAGLDAVLQGKKKIVLAEIIRLLVDCNGRCIPAHCEVSSAVCDENRDSRIVQPEINFAAIRERFIEFFPQGTKFMEVSEAEERLGKAKEKAEKNELIVNLFKRAHLPLFLPRHLVSDYGVSLQKFFIPAAQAAYKKMFPDRSFNNYCDGKMAGSFSVVDNVGHDQLLTAMVQCPAVAWYFPHTLQGFSVHAQREAMKLLLLQYGLLLTGIVEPTLGITGFTEAMAGSFSTPGYDCPAVSYKSVDHSFCFRAPDDGLYCNDCGSLGGANAFYSGGLVLLG
jgi:hypothetical protein